MIYVEYLFSVGPPHWSKTTTTLGLTTNHEVTGSIPGTSTILNVD